MHCFLLLHSISVNFVLDVKFIENIQHNPKEFQTIEYEIELWQEFWVKGKKQRPLLSYMYPICVIVISNHIYVEYKFLSNFML